MFRSPILCRSNAVAEKPALEQILMRRHGLTYAKSKKLVAECRQSLRMPGSTAWTEVLRLECEKVLATAMSVEKNPTIENKGAPSELPASSMVSKSAPSLPATHTEVAKEQVQPHLFESTNEDADDQSKVSSLNENSTSDVRTQQTTDVSSDEATQESAELFSAHEDECEEADECSNIVIEESESESVHKLTKSHSEKVLEDTLRNPSAYSSIKSEEPQGILLDLDEVLETNSTKEDIDATVTKEETHEICVCYPKVNLADLIADDCSAATDNSKCFTTAMEIQEDCEEESDDGSSECSSDSDSEDEYKSTAIVKPSSRKEEYNGDQETANTSSSSNTRVPAFVFIRSDLPPEVPHDEPLMQCFNTVVPPRLSRGQKISKAVTRKLMRFTGLSRYKTRLSDDDSELHIQTLVDL